MSETSEDKTKRNYIALLTKNQWCHQHTLFYVYPEESVNLLTDKVAFQQVLRKQYPDQPFLIRIQTKVGDSDGENVLQAYLTILTTVRASGLTQVVDQSFRSEMRVRSRTLSDAKVQSMAGSIDKQKPHNLKKVFGDVRIRRWTLLNKEMLVQV